MMTHVRIPSVPLITSDPYFSVWSPSDKLYETDTVHWTGAEKPIGGIVCVDQKRYRFMGMRGSDLCAVQTSLDISATSSVYAFEAGGISLKVVFRTPLLLPDLELVSRPCSYMDFEVSSLDGIPHSVQITTAVDASHCYDGLVQKPVVGTVFQTHRYATAWMGRTVQTPLGHSGDGVTIDWGYFYLACPAGALYRTGFRQQTAEERASLWAEADFGAVLGTQTGYFVFAYDDILSIMYFSSARKGYWTKGGKTVFDALDAAFAQHDVIANRCVVFDTYMENKAREQAGEEYALICAAAYRQTIAAHKLIEDEHGQVVFLSKECFSNGCIGTVDVSYPSVPLYLLLNPELVRGMLRPVYRFARLPVWDCDYAPHDVGRYPYATGQVYALRSHDGRQLETNGERMPAGEVYPPFYAYPEGTSIYDLKYQMPVEECGNMLIMEAALLICTGDATFAAEHLDLLEKWVCYLLRFGGDPGDQLCTDDFGGHLAHNINLAGKAIMGVAAYHLILKALGKTAKADSYLDRARVMAADFEARAVVGDHTALTFGSGYGWSLKYNLVWDQLFNTNLFSRQLIANEIRWYNQMQNKYGVPLDIREDYTKTDWVLWIAAMAETREERMELIRPIYRFLKDTPDRVPFTDFYFTSTAKQRSMQNRSVQGGLFMPILKEKLSR